MGALLAGTLDAGRYASTGNYLAGKTAAGWCLTFELLRAGTDSSRPARLKAARITLQHPNRSFDAEKLLVRHFANLSKLSSPRRISQHPLGLRHDRLGRCCAGQRDPRVCSHTGSVSRPRHVTIATPSESDAITLPRRQLTPSTYGCTTTSHADRCSDTSLGGRPPVARRRPDRPGCIRNDRAAKSSPPRPISTPARDGCFSTAGRISSSSSETFRPYVPKWPMSWVRDPSSRDRT